MTTNYSIVSIEGNIGSGKSTLLDALKQKYQDNSTIIFLKEPVDEWDTIKDKDGNTMLKKFYADQDKYAFPFQMMAYISRLKILRDIIKTVIADPQNHYVIITERSLYTDKFVFAKMLYDQHHIEDVCYQIYLNWFDEFAKDFHINNTIYVNTDPKKCYERIHTRARDGEELIPLSYLESCNAYHEAFLDPISGIQTQQLVLNGNVNIYENEDVLLLWLTQIDELISNR